MKEEHIKTLMKKSIVETSDDFTDALMQKVENLEEVSPVQILSFRKLFLISLVGLIFVSFVSYKYLAPYLSEVLGSVNSTRTPIYAMCLLVSLLGVNYILKLHQAYRKLS
jgi:hypothetical protein